MSNLANQIALVTGATRGIGAAIAAELKAQGATVIGTATSQAGAGARGGGGGGGADGDADVAADGFGARRLQGRDEFVGGGGEAVRGDEGGEAGNADREQDREHGDGDHQFDEGVSYAVAEWLVHSLFLADIAVYYDAV